MSRIFFVLALLVLTGCKDSQKQTAAPAAALTQLPTFKTLTFAQREFKTTAQLMVDGFPTGCQDQAVYNVQNADQAYQEVQALIDAHHWDVVNLNRGNSWVVWVAGELKGNVMSQKLLGEWWTNPDRTGVLSLCLFNPMRDGKIVNTIIPQEKLPK